MIHSVSPQSRPAVIFPLILKFWDGRTDGQKDVRTDHLCQNSDHYRPGLWSASWINLIHLI